MTGTSLRMDLSEIVRLADDLEDGARRIIPAVTPVVKRGANNIKKDAVRRARFLVGRHARHYPNSISYDLEVGPHRVVAEIGPDKGRRQGALGNIIEFGTSNNPPMPHLHPAAQVEIPRTEIALSRAALRAMLR